MEPNSNQAPNPGQMPPQMPNMPASNKGRSMGPMVGVIILVVALLVGGLYFWSQNNMSGSDYAGEEVDGKVEGISTQSDSDELSSIEADLSATDVESADAEVNVGKE